MSKGLRLRRTNELEMATCLHHCCLHVAHSGDTGGGKVDMKTKVTRHNYEQVIKENYLEAEGSRFTYLKMTPAQLFTLIRELIESIDQEGGIKTKQCKYCRVEFYPARRDTVRCVSCANRPKDWLEMRYGKHAA